MTLAFVFLLSVFSLAQPSPDGAVYSLGQSTGSGEAQSQGAAQQPPSEAKPASPSPKPEKTPVKRAQGKKKAAVGCKTSSPATGSSTSTTASPGGPTLSADSATTAKSCPPPKIVVRQGGTSDPSIRLAGGQSGGQATQAKDNATQMLDSTEENLKKLSGRQLSESEQDSVTQIRQFMDQSKTAVSAGDNERARTLAWKAQALSEDLVDPKK